LQFDFTRDANQELEELQRATSAPTKAETVRYALRALQWIVEEVGTGARIFVEEDGQKREVIFPFFVPTQKATPKTNRIKREYVAT
jgi:hypothetical protein